MKTIKTCFLAAALWVSASSLLAADAKSEKKSDKTKSYPLDKCLVTDEKLGGSDMKPYVFVHEGQEIKLCCKDCLKDFNKDKKKFTAKLEEEAKKTEKKTDKKKTDKS